MLSSFYYLDGKLKVKKESPNHQIVNDFIQHTDKYWNYKETGLNPNENRKLEQILQQYKIKIKTIDNNELERSLDALTRWREYQNLLEKKSYFLPTETDIHISDFFFLFR